MHTHLYIQGHYILYLVDANEIFGAYALIFKVGERVFKLKICF